MLHSLFRTVLTIIYEIYAAPSYEQPLAYQKMPKENYLRCDACLVFKLETIICSPREHALPLGSQHWTKILHKVLRYIVINHLLISSKVVTYVIIQSLSLGSSRTVYGNSIRSGYVHSDTSFKESSNNTSLYSEFFLD